MYKTNTYNLIFKYIISLHHTSNHNLKYWAKAKRKSYQAWLMWLNPLRQDNRAMFKEQE